MNITVRRASLQDLDSIVEFQRAIVAAVKAYEKAGFTPCLLEMRCEI